MAYKGMPMAEKLPSLAGCLGEGVAFEFSTYCDVYKHIPTYQDIKANPRGISITSEPMMLSAISGMVGSHVTALELPVVMPYIHRLPLEFQVFALRDAIKRTPVLRKDQEIIDWITVNGEALV